ncbi:Uncharacterised protein [Actinobacillus equuli]|nr:Uncharacterised protein [Actinobacillus equuli]
MKLILILLKIIFYLSLVVHFLFIKLFTGLDMAYTEFMVKLFPISVLAIGMAYWQKNGD